MDSQRPIKQFDAKVDQSQLALEWQKWKRSLEYYMAACGIAGQREKRNQLLHLGGPDLQDIFENLPGVNDVPHVSIDPPFYDTAIEKLDAHFQPTRRRTYERHVFRQIAQVPGERFNDFIMKLRVQANRCDFDENGVSVLDSMIIDQIAEKCSSAALRKKILEKDRSLSEVVAIGKTIEDVEMQCRELAPSNTDRKLMEAVNKINTQTDNILQKAPARSFSTFDSPQYGSFPSSKERRYQNIQTQQKSFRPENKWQQKEGGSRMNTPWKYQRLATSESENRICFGCGRRGHLKDTAVCVAKNAQCLKCGRIGHFAKWCTKRSVSNTAQSVPSKKIKAVYEENQQEPNQLDICYVMGQNIFRFKVGRIEIPMAIDSGAAANLIALNTWLIMEKAHAEVDFRPRADRNFKAYGTNIPLKIIGMFQATIEAGPNKTNATFYIAADGKQNLLGDETAKKLNVLKIGFDVSSVIPVQKAFPKIKGITVEIPIDPNVKPVQQLYRRAPFALEEKIAEKLRYLQEMDIIEPVSQPSPWVSPIVPILKDSGEVRICVDMRRANQAVLRENHPLPIVDELFGTINGAKRFSKLDIKEAYHQVEISERSREITTFITKQGLFRYKRLMFGISCAPEIFQKVMESIVAGLKGVIVYLDDILVTGKTQTEHDQNLKMVMSRLQQFGILLNEAKCAVNVSQLEFLGHELSDKGIRPMESKISAIKSFRKPNNIAELRSFLGLITYVGRFIPHLAEKTEPLRFLLRTGESFVWKTEHQNAFDEIKNSISESKFLGYFDPKDNCIVIADASPSGLGAVLLQEDNLRNTRIISFASKALTTLEKKYFQTEKEALALVWAVDKFRLYLLGKRFKLVTDCKPLHFLFKNRAKPCARIERWVLRLQAYQFDVVFEPGMNNLADCLSRLPVLKATDFDVCGDACIYQLAAVGMPNAITIQEVQEESSKDETFKHVFNSLVSNSWNENSKDFKPFRDELCKIGEMLLRGDRLVIPEKLRNRTLEIAHESHPGIVVMKRRMRQKVWWPHMDKHVEQFVKKCKACVLVSTADPPEPLRCTKIPERPWANLAADFLGPLPSGHNLLVLADYHSRFIEVIIMKQITASLTVRALHETFCRFGMPESLKTDNGPQFISTELAKFCEQFGIEHRRTTPYWPQANGEVERMNRSIGKRLKISQQTYGADWQWDLRMFILMHNSTPHSSTGVAPSTLMFGRVLKDKLPGLLFKGSKTLEEISDYDRIKKMKGAEYADKRRGAKLDDLQIGDTVVTKRIQKENKLATAYDPEEFLVVERKGPDVTLKSKESEKIIHRNVSHLKKLFSGNDESEDNIPTAMDEELTNLLPQGKPNAEEQQDNIPGATNSLPPRFSREKKIPKYLSDYDINCIFNP